MVTDYFPPHASGGVEHAIYEISRRLVEIGQAVTVLTLQPHRRTSRETLDGIAVIRVPGLELSRFFGVQVAVSAEVWPALLRELVAKRFDIVHVHTLFFHGSLAGALLTKLRQAPLVTTAHLGSPEDLPGIVGRVTSIYERTVGRLIINRSARVIAVSNAVAAHLRPLARHPERIGVIPNGVDLERFAPAATPPSGPPVVLFVGRLIFNKGPQFLVEAMPAIVAKHPDARFRFAGDGPMQDELEKRVRELGLEGQVEFLGQREDIPELLRQATIMARPSLSEGMPLVALEAMACGLPVVAADVGGTAEVVQDGVTGYVIEPENVEQLVERVNRLLGDAALRHEMGRAAREFVEHGYDWSSIAQRTLTVYEGVLATA